MLLNVNSNTLFTKATIHNVLRFANICPKKVARLMFTRSVFSLELGHLTPPICPFQMVHPMLSICPHGQTKS